MGYFCKSWSIGLWIPLIRSILNIESLKAGKIVSCAFASLSPPSPCLFAPLASLSLFPLFALLRQSSNSQFFIQWCTNAHFLVWLSEGKITLDSSSLFIKTWSERAKVCPIIDRTDNGRIISTQRQILANRMLKVYLLLRRSDIYQPTVS